MSDQATIEREEARSLFLSAEIDRLMLALGKINLPPGTCRWRMVKCGKCDHLHGPYLYVYRREKGHLEETYHGKDTEADQQISRAMQLSKEVRAAIWELSKIEQRLDRRRLKQSSDEVEAA